MADPGCRDVIELLFGLRAVRRLLGGTIKAITQRVTPHLYSGVVSDVLSRERADL
jgi:hypothetical protein